MKIFYRMLRPVATATRPMRVRFRRWRSNRWSGSAGRAPQSQSEDALQASLTSQAVAKLERELAARLERELTAKLGRELTERLDWEMAAKGPQAAVRERLNNVEASLRTVTGRANDTHRLASEDAMAIQLILIDINELRRDIDSITERDPR